MKVLTVKNPWAFLIIHYGKDIENRPRKLNYRGRIAIHAAKESMNWAFDRDLLDHKWEDDMISIEVYCALFDAAGKRAEIEKTNGHIIGTVEIYNCTYPDNYFDLAIIDAPYGSGDHNQRNHKIASPNRFGGRFNKYSNSLKRKTIHATGGKRFAKYDAACRTGGTWAAKYGADINEWDVAPPQEYFEELFRVSRYQIIWGGNYFHLPPSRNFIIWRKLTISESFSMAMVEQAWTNLKGNAKYFECMPQDTERFHPTQKPVKLYSWLLSNYAKSGWKILDTHMGSGSIAIACHNAGFDLTACEINKFYFDKAMERINKHIQQNELFDKKELFQERSLFEEDAE